MIGKNWYEILAVKFLMCFKVIKSCYSHFTLQISWPHREKSKQTYLVR